MPVRRVPALLAGSLALAVALTGCSEESAAPAPLDPTPTSASAASPSERPTGPPEMPDEARGTGRKAAVAFVRHWVDTLNYSADTLDSAPLKALSSPDCAACTGITNFIAEVESGSGSIRTDGWTITDAWFANRTGDLVQVAAQVLSGRQVVKMPGSRPKRYTGGPALKIFTLTRHASAWTVAELDQS